jgi:phospholipase/lecithinase/hemolysin
MLPFVHDRLQKLERLLERSNTALTKYSRLDIDLAAALTELLDEAIGHYKTANRADIENELLTLKALHTSAQRGVDPISLERVTTHRRDMQRAIALRVLQQSAQRLRADYSQDQQALADGGALLRPIVLQAMHKGLIDGLSRRTLTQQQLDDLWQTMLSEPEIQLAARQVAMLLSPIDIQLLLGDLIAAGL